MNAALVQPSFHARTRAIERLGADHQRHAGCLLQTAWADGIKLSWRWLPRLQPPDRRTTAVHRRTDGKQLRVYSDILMVGRGRTVITAWRLDDEAFASLMVRLALGVWP